MEKLIVLLLRIYRYCVSPFLGDCCRFNPSCSEYAEEALQRFGVFKGGRLLIGRLGRCHPWHIGGEDPVPEIFFEKWQRC